MARGGLPKKKTEGKKVYFHSKRVIAELTRPYYPVAFHSAPNDDFRRMIEGTVGCTFSWQSEHCLERRQLTDSLEPQPSCIILNEKHPNFSHFGQYLVLFIYIYGGDS